MTAPKRRPSAVRAAIELVKCYRELDRRGGHLVEEVVGRTTFRELTAYPRKRATDPRRHFEWYFHAHHRGELGHFHTFVNRRGIPPSLRPLIEGEKTYAHLVAIGVDDRGFPVRLDIPNRWATSETWYAADDLSVMLDRFDVRGASGPPLVNRWLHAVLCLFRPEIDEALRERDRIVRDVLRRQPRARPTERRSVPLLHVRRLDLHAALARAT
jgi:hypothetical protein